MEERKLPFALLSRNLSTIVLKILSKDPLYGYGITLEIKRRYGKIFSYGNIYPTLYGLQTDDLIRETSTNPVIISGRSAKYYEITENGRVELANRIRHLEILLQSLNAKF